MSAATDAAEARRRTLRRWRLPVVALVSFGISATLPSIVSATVGGDVRSYVGDDEDNSVIGGDGDDTMTGSDGDDFFQGLLGADTLHGEEDDDTLIGDTTVGAYADWLTGGDGNDSLAGFDGPDTLRGNTGDDVLGTIDFSRVGGPATVEHGHDTLYGDAGNDTLLAGPGNDLVFGDEGWDTLSGDVGDDRLEPGTGDDVVDGGVGTDTLAFAWLDQALTVDLGAGTASGAGSDTFTEMENVVGGNGGDTITGDGGVNLLAGNSGADTLDGHGGGDVLEGGDGADTLRTTGTDVGDTLRGGAGSDRIEARNGVVDTIDCGEESDPSGDIDVAIVDTSDTVVGCEKVRLPDTEPPNTRITSAPDSVVKTRRRAVEVTYEFKSTEAKSTFECRVDDALFASCTSPKTVRLSRGVHVFEVRAIDAAGNVDQTPAMQEITVKRRRG